MVTQKTKEVVSAYRGQKSKKVYVTFNDDHLKRLLDTMGSRQKRDTTVVVIDTLRFTTTVPAALDAGAEMVVPAFSPRRAINKRDMLRERHVDAVAAAEKAGLPVAGVDRGPSPRFKPRELEGKTLVISTSHGTKTTRRAIDGRVGEIVFASAINLSAVSNHLNESGKGNIIFATAGSKYSKKDIKRFGLGPDKIEAPGTLPLFVREKYRKSPVKSGDDIAVAVELAMMIRGGFETPDIPKRARYDLGHEIVYDRDMIERIKWVIDGEEGDLPGFIERSRWGRRLVAIDRMMRTNTNTLDLRFAMQVDASSTVPVWDQQKGGIVAKKAT